MYVGQAVKPIITPKMDSLLWAFVKNKGMDEKMFRALVRPTFCFLSLKAALQRAFSACNYSMLLRLQRNYVGWLKPK